MRRCGSAVAMALVALVCAAAAQSGKFYNPGYNFFTPQQDVQAGRQAEAQELAKLPILRDSAAEKYVTQLGLKLAQQIPGPKFPYRFHIVNSKDINAFALPGGAIFVNKGAICAAGNEAQLAGVMAHEESHVALRHSTHMASQQELYSVPLAIFGSALGSGAGASVARLAAQIGVQAMFLKYSRTDESQADALGAQVMSKAGYDPRQMAAFFQKLEAQPGSSTLQFLSDHPNPGNRTQAIDREIPELGPHPPYQDNSPQFAGIHARLCGGH
ncbi:MAG: M48 family metallopeptidase [Terriglobales bacterium]